MITCKTCSECKGSGSIDEVVCISEWEPPDRHERYDELEQIIRDAQKAKSDHRRLCELNPRAKDSYDSQLSQTLNKLEDAAKEIL